VAYERPPHERVDRHHIAATPSAIAVTTVAVKLVRPSSGDLDTLPPSRGRKSGPMATAPSASAVPGTTRHIRELRKQLSWLPEPVDVGHWHTHDGVGVDLVVERMDGGIIGFEIKSDTRVPGKAFQGLRQLRDRLGGSFLGGIVLYTGERSYTYEDRLHAVPVDRLWT
jgi:hypothetical protein